MEKLRASVEAENAKCARKWLEEEPTEDCGPGTARTADRRPGTGARSLESPEPMKIPIEDSIDLHAFAPRDVASVVEEYLNAAHEAGLREVRMIHGRGKGVQRGLVQQVLERHPLVVEFWDAPESHLGATVARLVVGSK
jgi:DNA-nicking Smr family endonuclease